MSQGTAHLELAARLADAGIRPGRRRILMTDLLALLRLPDIWRPKDMFRRLGFRVSKKFTHKKLREDQPLALPTTITIDVTDSTIDPLILRALIIPFWNARFQLPWPTDTWPHYMFYPDVTREVAWLHVMGRWSVEAIAERYDLSPAFVKRWVSFLPKARYKSRAWPWPGATRIPPAPVLGFSVVCGVRRGFPKGQSGGYSSSSHKHHDLSTYGYIAPSGTDEDFPPEEDE